MDSEHVEYTACEKVGTKVYVAVDGQYAGCILITDEVKPDSKKAISDLKHIGVEKTVMLTGDDEKIRNCFFAVRLYFICYQNASGILTIYCYINLCTNFFTGCVLHML